MARIYIFGLAFDAPSEGIFHPLNEKYAIKLWEALATFLLLIPRLECDDSGDPASVGMTIAGSHPAAQSPLRRGGNLEPQLIGVPAATADAVGQQLWKPGTRLLPSVTKASSYGDAAGMRVVHARCCNNVSGGGCRGELRYYKHQHLLNEKFLFTSSYQIRRVIMPWESTRTPQDVSNRFDS